MHSCYLDTHLAKELLAEAKEKREAIYLEQVTKTKTELKTAEEERTKDGKKIAAIKKKLENLEGSCSAVQDGEATITQITDGSTRSTSKER